MDCTIAEEKQSAISHSKQSLKKKETIIMETTETTTFNIFKLAVCPESLLINYRSHKTELWELLFYRLDTLPTAQPTVLKH